MGCATDAVVQNGVWVRQNPVFESPINLGAHCAKGAALREHGHGEYRLKYPMKLVDGKYQKISWDEALDAITKKMLALREENGPDSVFFIGSSKHNNEQSYLLRKWVSMWGTNNTARKTNPVDMEMCTRCGACVDACPTQSISKESLTIDLNSCDQSGACIKACGDFKAISFADMSTVTARQYDMVIDCTMPGLFADRQAPLGYWHVGDSDQLLLEAMLDAVQTVGEFEKPKFFEYKSSICAHSRSNKEGCNSCIDACSTKAIKSAGEKIEVNPHLCLGCGACTTVCPTGAIQFALSPATVQGRSIKSALKAFRANAGKKAEVVLHGPDLEHNWLESAKKAAKPASGKAAISDFSLLPVYLLI